MTRVRRIISMSMLIALLVAPAQTANAADEGPVHSGTIVTGYGSVSGPGTCQAAPDCSAWLQSGCDPALTGRDLAITASIEDVSGLADGRTSWLFEFNLEADCCWAQVMVQLWQRDCSEISSGRWNSADCNADSPEDHCALTSIRIPDSAKWMTVTAKTWYIPWVGELLKPLTVNWSLSQPAPRVVDFGLRRHLRAVGTVVTEDRSCRAEVRVVIQTRNKYGWWDLGTEITNPNGEFELRLYDDPAPYRAIALPISSPEGPCLGTISQTVRHRH